MLGQNIKAWEGMKPQWKDQGLHLLKLQPPMKQINLDQLKNVNHEQKNRHSKL